MPYSRQGSVVLPGQTQCQVTPMTLNEGPKRIINSCLMRFVDWLHCIQARKGAPLGHLEPPGSLTRPETRRQPRGKIIIATREANQTKLNCHLRARAVWTASSDGPIESSLESARPGEPVGPLGGRPRGRAGRPLCVLITCKSLHSLAPSRQYKQGRHQRQAAGQANTSQVSGAHDS